MLKLHWFLVLSMLPLVKSINASGNLFISSLPSCWFVHPPFVGALGLHERFEPLPVELQHPRSHTSSAPPRPSVSITESFPLSRSLSIHSSHHHYESISVWNNICFIRYKLFVFRQVDFLVSLLDCTCPKDLYSRVPGPGSLERTLKQARVVLRCLVS